MSSEEVWVHQCHNIFIGAGLYVVVVGVNLCVAPYGYQPRQFDPLDGWPQHKIRILKVQENWLKVDMTLKNEKYNGWMPSYSLCSHPHTTCN